MKKSRTLKMFSARAAMLMLAAIFSAGAWAQSQGTFSLIGTYPGPYKAVIYGDTESDVENPQGAGTMLNEIECERVFKIGVPATIVLPFPTTGMTVTGGKFYEFACVDYDETKGQWVASMTSVAANNLQRNTPYIIVPTATKLEFDLHGNLVHYYTGDATVSCDCWNFVGTYKTVRWVDKSVDVASSEIKVMDKDMNCVEVGDYYGFAAKEGTSIGTGESVAAGEFVKCSGDGYFDTSAFIYPLRAYLQYVGDDANNDTKKLTRQSGNNRPTSIAVVLRDANGEVTNVGAISKETGEITFEGWFTIDGIKLPAEPTKSGVYIHNGKKVVVK
jgi:hypothetical protein